MNIRKLRCPEFDVHDQQLIETARITGHPAHIAQAIAVAVAGFKTRLRDLPNGIPIIDGRPHLLLASAARGNFFDHYTITLTLADIADTTGQIVTVLYTGPKVRTNKPSSPDIEFDAPCKRPQPPAD